MAGPCDHAAYSVEVHFAQRLAANEKKIRDRAVKRLRQWIGARSRKDTGLEETEFMKLWKGLFYCMWMCDKAVIQEELADQVSDMVHCFHQPHQAIKFYDTFLLTMKREWIGIDHLRMDKYLMLVRRSFRQMLVLLHNNEWDDELIELFLGALRRSALNPDMDACPDGLRYQMANVYLDELAREGTEDLSPEKASMFLVPFAELAAKTLNKKLRDVILEDVFQDVVERSNVGEEKEEEDEGIASDEERKKRKPRLSKKKREDDDEDDVDEEEDEVEDDVDILEKVMFPEEMVPPLEYDYGFIAEKLFELASGTGIPPRNRKPVYRMVQRYQSLSKGVYPMRNLLEEIRNEKDSDYLKDELPWWKKLQAKEKQKKRRRKRRRGKKGGEAGEDDEEGEDEGLVQRKRRKMAELVDEPRADSRQGISRKKREKRSGAGSSKAEANVERMSIAESSDRTTSKGGEVMHVAVADVKMDHSSLSSRKVKRNKKGKRKGDDPEAAESSAAKGGALANSTPRLADVGKVLFEDAPRVDTLSGEKTVFTPSLAPFSETKRKKKGKSALKSATGDNDETKVTAALPKVDTVEVITSPQGERLKGLKVSCDRGQEQGAKAPQQFASFQKVATPPAYVKKTKVKSTEAPSTLPRSKAKSHKVSQYTPPMTRKRVKIALSKNEVQAAHEYKQRVKLSPGVPFDGSKKPKQSVLKQTPQKSVAEPCEVRSSVKGSTKSKKRRSKATDFF